MIFFVSGISLFIQTAEPSDFDSISNKTFLDFDFSINEHCFKDIPNNSIVILDDFSFKHVADKQEKLAFLKVVNYVLRHHKITLFLIVHNLYNTSLSSSILMAPHLFLSYSNLGFQIIR